MGLFSSITSFLDDAFDLTDFLDSVPDFLKDPDVVLSGLQVAGQLVQGLAQRGDNKKRLDVLNRELDIKEKQFEESRADAEKTRQLQLKLAEIQARANAGMVKPDLTAFDSAAKRLIEGSSVESQNIGNLISGTVGALR